MAVLGWLVMATVILFIGGGLVPRILAALFLYGLATPILLLVPWRVTINAEELILDYLPFAVRPVRLRKEKVGIVVKQDDMKKNPKDFEIKAISNDPIFPMPGLRGIKAAYLSGAPTPAFERRSDRMMELLLLHGFRITEV